MSRLPTQPSQVDRKYYEVAKPRSIAERMVVLARDNIYDDFLRIAKVEPKTRILDVGVSDVGGDAANVLERRYPYPDLITAAGLGSFASCSADHPNINYVQIIANRRLPFSDQQFDVATSNAVLEHVGSADNQRLFISELLRVSRQIFVTIPNRFFPIEHHTGIPVFHWTDVSFKLACQILNKKSWSERENLILMSRRRLSNICGDGVRYCIGNTGIRLGVCSSNLYLHGQRCA